MVARIPGVVWWGVTREKLVRMRRSARLACRGQRGRGVLLQPPTVLMSRETRSPTAVARALPKGMKSRPGMTEGELALPRGIRVTGVWMLSSVLLGGD